MASTHHHPPLSIPTSIDPGYLPVPAPRPPPAIPEPRSFNAFGISRTDEFADLIIQCGEESWSAHRIVVCGRSPVLRAAVTKGWKEAADSTYRVTAFEPGIVDRMLEFMYTGKYDVDSVGTPYSFPSPYAALFGAHTAPKHKKNPVRTRGMNATVGALFLHLEMNAIGEFYDVDQLRETAVYRIRLILAESWEAVFNWYPAFLEEAFGKTNDAGLHCLLVEVTGARLDELRGSLFGGGAFLEVPASFYSAVLAKSQESMIGMREVLSTADSMWETLTTRLDTLVRERGF